MRIYSNTAVATSLVGAIGAADTSLTLADATGFPVPGTGESALLWIEGELLEYTSLAGAVVSGVTRGVDGTTAASHAAGKDVAHVASARDVEAAQKVVRGRGGSGDFAYGWPGMVLTQAFSQLGMTAGRLYYEPIRVDTEITLDRIAIEVTTAAAAGAVCRLGIARADRDWVATDLVLDAGTVAVDSNGIKEIAIDLTLKPGRYLLMLNTSAATPSLRVRVDPQVVYGYYNNGQNLANSIVGYEVDRAEAAFAEPLPAGVPQTSTSTGKRAIVVRVSVP